MSADVGAEATGDVLAEARRVQRPAEEQREQRTDDQERRDLRDHGGVATGERADLPEAELVEVASSISRNDVVTAADGRAHGGARERQLDRRGALAPERREAYTTTVATAAPAKASQT